MNNKKDIDNLYRERFKNAKVKPPEDAWEQILSRLPDKHTKKRVLPMWYLIAGTAAAIVLFFVLFPGTPGVENYQRIVSEEAEVELLHEKIEAASEGFQNEMKAANILLEQLRKIPYQSKIIEDRSLAKVSKSHFEADFNSSEGLDVLKKSFSSKDFSQTVASAEENPVKKEDVLGSLKDEQVTVAEVENLKNEKRFSVTTRIAPVFFNNFGKGNPLDSKFAQNNSGGELSISYGVNMAYKVSEKVKIRSGISKVDLAYHTTEVSFNDFSSASNKKARESMGTMLASPVKGKLNQSFGFVEVPLEVEYALLDRRIGVNLIGGGSALFLDSNEISLTSQTFSSSLGEAENLNKLSFSTNIGLGIDYDFTRNFGVSIEPVLKLQLNTFKDVQGLNPYYFGVYSGLSYKF